MPTPQLDLGLKLIIPTGQISKILGLGNKKLAYQWCEIFNGINIGTNPSDVFQLGLIKENRNCNADQDCDVSHIFYIGNLCKNGN